MKKGFHVFALFSFVLFLVNCASFTPGTINLTSAVSTPGAIDKEGVSVFVRELGPTESQRLFDCDIQGEGYTTLSMAISNRSNSVVDFLPSTIPQYVNVEEVLSKTDFSPTTRLILWSVPWVINIAANQPIYYGILWPIIGLVDMGKANTGNRNRADFFNNIAIRPIKLQPGQDIQGIVFVRKNYPKPFQLVLMRNDYRIVFDIFPNF